MPAIQHGLRVPVVELFIAVIMVMVLSLVNGTGDPLECCQVF